jgi:hypothetical protein
MLNGHVLNHPEIPVSRLEGLFMVSLFAVSAVFSFAFTKRSLNLVDRVALNGFVICFFWQIVDGRAAIPVLTVGAILIFMAWLNNRFQERHRQDHAA